MGTKKKPYYRIVAATGIKKRDGQFLEILGLYHPVAAKGLPEVRLEKEKIETWLAKGATPSDTVKSLLSKAGIWKAFTAERDKRKTERVRRQKAKKKAVTT